MAPDGEPAVDDLPHALGTLIGRADETAEIVSLLATARLFTLTGTGGSGKTRLAAQVAAERLEAFRDGVRWVGLEMLADPTLVPHVVAARCGVADRGGTPVLEALAAALRDRNLLLVLDNCEHLLPACSRLVETLLASSPSLHVLTTSREALALPGEVIWHVAPLRVPEEGGPDAVEGLLAYEAVALFVARAAAVLPGFRLTEETAASVVRICRRVEGLPLALELAAARLRVLSPAELAERLDDALHLLTRGSRTAPPRQQTLRATLDWSYQLLSEAERAIFGRVAVFSGSFSLGAAELVCAGAGVAQPDVLDVLSRLVEKSLVAVQDRGAETRYRVLEPIRQYARERLRETGETEQVQRRHRDWCADLATQASTQLFGPEQGRWLDRLETEHDHLRAALGWSLAHDEPATAGEIAAGIWQFWLLRGHVHEGRRWLEQVLAALPGPTPLRAQLLWIAGILARPDMALARLRFEESLTMWRALGDREGAARALGSLGFTSQAHGEHARAVAYLEQSLPLVRDSADQSALARVLTGLALSVLAAGDIARAESLCREGLELSRRIGDPRGVAAATANLGLVWQERSDEQRAADLWEESLALRRRIGDLGGVAHVLALLGDQAARQGAHPRATALYLKSLALRSRIGELDGVAPLLEALAAIDAVQGDPVRAVQLAAAADALRATTGLPLPPRGRAAHDRTLSALRARLDPNAFGRAWEEGRAASPEQALALATATTALTGNQGRGAAAERPSPKPEPPSARPYDLTRRETDVLRLLTFGLTYAQIAESLTISPRTVDAHVRAIFGKLDVRSRSAATRVALEARLV